MLGSNENILVLPLLKEDERQAFTASLFFFLSLTILRLDITQGLA